MLSEKTHVYVWPLWRYKKRQIVFIDFSKNYIKNMGLSDADLKKYLCVAIFAFNKNHNIS